VSLSRVHTWARNEILLSTDLNAEFNNILSNGSSLVFPLSTDLDVGSKLLINTGLQNPSQLHDAILSMDKFSNSLPVAIASIGSSKITLLVGSAITVGADATIPDNIILWFVGPGKLFVNSGKVLTINSPSQVLAHTQQQVFDGLGTITFTNGGIVSPGWWGFSSGGTAATNTDAYNACATSITTSGGAIIIPPTGSAHQVDGPLTHPNESISVVGAHQDLSIIESTSTTSSDHGLIFSNSFHLKNLTIKTATSLASNLSMRAVSLFAPSTTNRHAVLEHVKVRGFNTGVYIDGGASRNIDRVLLRDIDIQTSGPASDYAGSCLYIVRCTQVECYGAVLDQNSTGNHAILLEGNTNLTVVSTKVRNATRTGAFSVYAVGVDGTSSAVYKSWTFQGLDVESCYNGVLIRTYDTESLHCASLRDSSFKNITGDLNYPGAISTVSSGTSTIRKVTLEDLSIIAVGYSGIYQVSDTGAFTLNTDIRNITAFEWSNLSSGTYTFYNMGTLGTFYRVMLSNIVADGNSLGRTIVNANSKAATCRLAYDRLTERNTTTPGTPAVDSSTSATFDFSFGNVRTVSGTRTVTAASNGVPGEVYHIVGTNANCTFTDNAVFLLNGNWVSAANKSLTLLCLTSSTFQELTRNAS